MLLAGAIRGLEELAFERSEAESVLCYRQLEVSQAGMGRASADVLSQEPV